MSRLRSRLLVPGRVVALLLVVFPGGTRGAFPDELRLPKYQECWALPADELAMLRRARHADKRLKDAGPELVSAGVLGPRATLASIPRVMKTLGPRERLQFQADTFRRVLPLVSGDEAAEVLCTMLATPDEGIRTVALRAIYYRAPNGWSRGRVQAVVSLAATQSEPRRDILADAAALSLLRRHPRFLAEFPEVEEICTRAAVFADLHTEVWAQCAAVLGMYPEPRPYWALTVLNEAAKSANPTTRVLAELAMGHGQPLPFARVDYSDALQFPETYPMLISSLRENFLLLGTTHGEQFVDIPGMDLKLSLLDDALAQQSEAWSHEVLRLVRLVPARERTLYSLDPKRLPASIVVKRIPYFDEPWERLRVDVIALQCQCEGAVPTPLLATALDPKRDPWIRAHCVRRLSMLRADWGRGTRIPFRAILRADKEWSLAVALLGTAEHWASDDELLGAVDYLLSNDSSPFWLSTIAAMQGLTSANVDLPVALARRISEHPCAEVRQGLARYVRGKPKYREVSRALKADEDDYVRDAFGER